MDKPRVRVVAGKKLGVVVPIQGAEPKNAGEFARVWSCLGCHGYLFTLHEGGACCCDGCGRWMRDLGWSHD